MIYQVLFPQEIIQEGEDPNRHKNVYYKPRDGTWEARINFNKVKNILYRGSELEAIEAVRDFKKLHGIK